MFFSLHFTGFPNVLGCIDGTFIKNKALTEIEPNNVNRKGFLFIKCTGITFSFKKSTKLIFKLYTLLILITKNRFRITLICRNELKSFII